jgi:hypothetical protein
MHCVVDYLQDSYTAMWSVGELGQLYGVVYVVEQSPIDSQHTVASLQTSPKVFQSPDQLLFI